jgi:hypothetical protein
MLDTLHPEAGSLNLTPGWTPCAANKSGELAPRRDEDSASCDGAPTAIAYSADQGKTDATARVVRDQGE